MLESRLVSYACLHIRFSQITLVLNGQEAAQGRLNRVLLRPSFCYTHLFASFSVRILTHCAVSCCRAGVQLRASYTSSHLFRNYIKAIGMVGLLNMFRERKVYASGR